MGQSGEEAPLPLLASCGLNHATSPQQTSAPTEHPTDLSQRWTNCCPNTAHPITFVQEQGASISCERPLSTCQYQNCLSSEAHSTFAPPTPGLTAG